VALFSSQLDVQQSHRSSHALRYSASSVPRAARMLHVDFGYTCCHFNHHCFQIGQRNHCPASSGPAQVSWQHRILKMPAVSPLLLERINQTKHAPRRALPTACELVRQRPFRALTAVCNRRSEALRGRSSPWPCQPSPCRRVKTLAGGILCSPYIPADLVVDHEPRLGRRAPATGSGCSGAVGFQLVGVKQLPWIDDVQDREIDDHRRENRQSSAYAASVSFASPSPTSPPSANLACKESSFSLTPLSSASLHPHAESAPSSSFDNPTRP
jgi:hypothetical protein